MAKNRPQNFRYALSKARNQNLVQLDEYLNRIINRFRTSKWYKLFQSYTNPCHFENVDLIKISTDDFDTLYKTLPHEQYSLEDVYQALARETFSFTFTDKDENGVAPLICFRPTRLPSEIIHLPDHDGEDSAVSFRTDMFVSFDDGITTNLACAIGICYEPDGGESLFTLPVWLHPNLDSFLNLPEHPSELSYLSRIYPTIQVAQRERPEIFVTEKKQIVVIPQIQHKKSRKSTKPKVEKTREIRIIRIDINRQPKPYTPPTAEQEITAHSYTLKKQTIHVAEYSYYRNGKKITVAAHDREVKKDKKVHVRTHKRNPRKDQAGGEDT